MTALTLHEETKVNRAQLKAADRAERERWQKEKSFPEALAAIKEAKIEGQFSVGRFAYGKPDEMRAWVKDARKNPDFRGVTFQLLPDKSLYHGHINWVYAYWAEHSLLERAVVRLAAWRHYVFYHLI